MTSICPTCNSTRDARHTCWNCAVARLPKKKELQHVNRSSCVECGYDAPVWVESDNWTCKVCRNERYADRYEEE
jgi:hypothetical protein